MKADNLLRRIRLTLGMSQQQLADALGVARQTISDSERGDAPRERIMAALLLAFAKLDRARREEARRRRPFG